MAHSDPNDFASLFNLFERPGVPSPFAAERKVKGRHGPTKFFATEEERLAYVSAEAAKSPNEYLLERFRAVVGDAPWKDFLVYWLTTGATGFELTVPGAADTYLQNLEERLVAGEIPRATVTTMGRPVAAFAERFPNGRMRLMFAAEIEEWFDEFEHLPGKQRNLYAGLRAFYNFFSEALGGYNPMRWVPQVDSDSKPTAMPVDDIFRLLEVAISDPDFSRYAWRFVCSVLAGGMRHAQARRLRFSDIRKDGANSGIDISFDNNRKSVGRRFIKGFPDVFWAYFDACPKPPAETGEVSVNAATYKAALRRLFDKAGLQAIRGALRDSFASYHLAVYDDAELTGPLMCHDDCRTVLRFYEDLVTKEEGLRYLAMRPGYLPEKRSTVIAA